MTPLPRNVTPRLIDLPVDNPSTNDPGSSPEDLRPSDQDHKFISMDQWWTIGRHIFYGFLWLPLAMAALLLILALGWSIATLDVSMFQGFALFGWVWSFFSLVFFLIIFAAIGVIATLSMVGLVAAIDRTVRIQLSPILAGAFAGGLATGGVLTLSMLADSLYFPELDTVIVRLLLAAIATAVGQHSGAIGGYNAITEYADDETSREADPHSDRDSQTAPVARKTIWNFSLRQMLIAVAWIAGLLTLLKLMDLLTPQSAGAGAIWFVLQAGMLTAGRFVWPHYIRWRTRPPKPRESHA